MNILTLPKEGRPGILVVEVEGEHWKDIHIKIFGKNPFFFKNCSSWNELETQFKETEYRQAKNYALKRLAAKSQPSIDLKKNLESCLVTSSTIQRILDECSLAGYLNDQEWIERFIQGQLSKKIGPQMIRMKLKVKGIPSHILDPIFNQLIEASDCKEQILHLLKTRYKSKNLSNLREKQKVIASLMRRGFDYSQVKEALNCGE